MSKAYNRAYLFCILLLLVMTAQFGSGKVFAETTKVENRVQKKIVTIEINPEVKTIEPGKEFWVAVTFYIDPDWHLYWENPGSVGAPPKLNWILPNGFSAGKALLPTPTRFVINNSVVFGYSQDVTLLVPIHASTSLKEGEEYDFEADVSWLACGNNQCVPGKDKVQFSLKAKQGPSDFAELKEHLFTRARKYLPVESSYDVALKDQVVEVTMHADAGTFQMVSEVLFFPNMPGFLPPEFIPTWKSSEDGSSLTFQIPTSDLIGNLQTIKINGVVSVQFYLGSLKLPLSFFINKEVKGTKTPVAIESSDSEGRYYKYDGNREIPAEESIQTTEQEIHSFWQKVMLWSKDVYDHMTNLCTSDFGYILLLAFGGGILLNVMPCVLPVVSLKLLHFVHMRGQSKSLILKHGLVFSLGILLSFWVLAGATFALQSAGKTVGWGFQLQEPLFVAVMIIVLLAFSLALFGVFEFGVGIMNVAQEFGQSVKMGQPAQVQLPSVSSSFWSGVIATFIATPCTGPLLGSAIGFAATLDPFYAFLLFTALGIGMAFPYLFFSLFPSLSALCPRPGRWMVTFKQLMGFFMLATAFWLIVVLQAETVDLSFAKLLIGCFFISLGLWVYGTWSGFDRKIMTRAIAKLLSLIIFLFGSYVFLKEVYISRGRVRESQEQIKTATITGKSWEPFSLSKLNELRSKNVPVFIDVTAKWCLTCQANALILSSKNVKEAFVNYGVYKMYADWTQGDETITEYLRSLGRNGVPTYVLYDGTNDASPELLPELLTPEIVISSLKKTEKKE